MNKCTTNDQKSESSSKIKLRIILDRSNVWKNTKSNNGYFNSMRIGFEEDPVLEEIVTTGELHNAKIDMVTATVNANVRL